MEPGFEVRDIGLQLIADDFDFGYDEYEDGNRMISEAAGFVGLSSSIIDYGITTLHAISVSGHGYFGLWVDRKKHDREWDQPI